MSRQDNIRRAKEILANKRANNISSYELRNAEISSLYPEFKEITSELNLTGLKIMGAAIGKNSDSASLDQIHEEYDRLFERKKTILKENGYPEDYCDIKFDCQKCSDTGYVGIDICDCLRRELVYISLETSGLYNYIKSQNFSTFSLDYYAGEDKTFMSRNLSILKSFTENFVPNSSDSFLFIGATGLGKTHLSSAVACELIKKGAYVVYETSLKLFGDYEARRFGNRGFSDEDGDDVERYLDCDLLVIDDLGCEMTNQFTVSCLYNIINTRMMKHKSTIISTNLNQAELRKRYSDRIASRLFSEYKPLFFHGYDVREQKLRK